MHIEGVYVPVVTPFDSHDEIDFATLTRVVEFVIDGGVAGIVACGTTGEYYALSHDERIAVMAHIGLIAKGRVQLVAGCNAGSTREAIQFAAAAKEMGFDGLMLAAPPTSLPRDHELAAHVIAIAESCGLPTILYNYPARAGVEYSLDCLDLVADHPLIVAIKESSGDFSRFLHLRSRYAGKIQVMCGSDDQAADYFFWGVRAWLAGTANVLPAEHVEMQNVANAGDHAKARDLFDKMLPWVQHMESGSYNQKAKLGLKHRGIDCGGVRMPLAPLDPDVAAANLAVLDAALA